MKTKIKSALIASFALTQALAPAHARNGAYIEFLWSPTPPGALARGEAFGFVLDGRQNHQICVAAVDDLGVKNSLRIDRIDSTGNFISSTSYDNFDGTKRCYPADLRASAATGTWTFNIYINRKLSATKTIEVSKTLESADFYKMLSQPYVLGRPNYNASIPANEYIGKLTWIMHVDETGKVTHVELETSEGAGNRMEERAIAAGYLTIFPPDASRTSKPLKIRQEYILGTN